jgi:sugar phosphate isomerase/epimerase
VEELSGSYTVGVNFNVAHLYCAGEDPVEAWDRIKTHVGHVELSDALADGTHRHVQLGEGDIDIQGFLKHVDESGYEGFVTIEMESQEHDPAAIVSASAGYLREHGFLLDPADR